MRGEDGPKLAREHDRAPVRGRQIQGFDPELVARQRHGPGLGVGDGQSKHAVEPVERRVAPLSPRRQNDLGVAGGRKFVPERRQLVSQLTIVVDLTVVDDRISPIGRPHRLVAGFSVDHGQSAVSQPEVAARHIAFTVGPTVHHRVGHSTQHRHGVLVDTTDITGNPAHRRSPRFPIAPVDKPTPFAKHPQAKPQNLAIAEAVLGRRGAIRRLCVTPGRHLRKARRH